MPRTLRAATCFVAQFITLLGPALTNGELAGLFVFTTEAAETDRLAASDPAVQAGKMTPERHPWMVADGVLAKSFRFRSRDL